MSTECSESLPQGGRAQIWIIGTREQVIHLLQEFCIKQIVSEHTRFMPPIPIASAPGKFMSLVER